LVPQPGNSTIAANGAANRQDWTGKTLTGLPFRRAFVTRNSLGAFTHSDLNFWIWLQLWRSGRLREFTTAQNPIFALGLSKLSTGAGGLAC
jgi:hypothetical protein